MFEILGHVAKNIFGLHVSKGNFLKCAALLTSDFFDFHFDLVAFKFQAYLTPVFHGF